MSPTEPPTEGVFDGDPLTYHVPNPEDERRDRVAQRFSGADSAMRVQMLNRSYAKLSPQMSEVERQRARKRLKKMNRALKTAMKGPKQ